MTYQKIEFKKTSIADHVTYSQSYVLKAVTWSSFKSRNVHCNNQIMHTFGTLALTWTLSAMQSRREKCDVAVAPWQNRLGARTKRTGMYLAVVHVINNKTLRGLFVFLCGALGWCSNGLSCLMHSPSACASSSLDHYCIVLVHAH